MNFFVPEATPVRVAGVLQTLRATGPIAASRLEFLLSPPSLRRVDQPAVIAPLLQFLVDWELVELRDGTYHLHSRLAPDEVESYPGTLRVLSHRLLGKNRDGNQRDADPFALLLAWYLDQPLTKLPNTAADLHARRDQWEPLGIPSLDPEKFRHFLSWGKSLGLLTSLSIGRKEELVLIVVNPVPFLRRQLPLLMTVGEAIPAAEWLKNLADPFPIFDGGSVRERIRRSEDQILSPSLTFALRQLAESKMITLEDRKDAPRMRLRLGRTEQSFSHVTLHQGGGA